MASEKSASNPAQPAAQETDASLEAPWPNPRYAWYVVGVLVLAYTSSFIDRQIMSLLVGPIRADLGISDTQFSLLVGFAFAMFYSVMGLPIAYLSDHYSRRAIIGVGITTWSIMTALCGLAQSFWGLFAARVGVGVGEATLSPAAISLIADYFPKERRGLATAVYATGVYFGSGLALIIGGIVVGYVSQAGTVTVPVIGEVAPWQMTFFYVGLPGVLIALLMFSIREPVRRGLKSDLATRGSVTDAFKALFVFIRQRALTVAMVFSGFSMLGMAVIAYLVWTPAMFIRVHGWEASQIGIVLGLIVLVAGSGGILTGGWLGDYLAARGRKDAALRATLYGGVPAVPLSILAPIIPDPVLSLVVLTLALFCLTTTQALPVVALQLITPNQMRAQMSALYFFVGSLLIFSFGPTSVALLTDYLFGNDQAVHYSLSIACAILTPIGVLIAFLSLTPYKRSVDAAAEWE